MRDDVLALMRTLVEGIATDEAMARSLGAIANLADDIGGYEIAKAMSVVVRNHRIRALEMRGQLAALRIKYGLAGEGESA